MTQEDLIKYAMELFSELDEATQEEIIELLKDLTSTE